MNEREPAIEYTPKDAAKDFIRPYVRRGDSLDSLRKSQMGRYSPHYHAAIGGVIFPRGGDADAKPRVLRGDRVGITRVAGTPTEAVFSLTELYDEVVAEEQDGVRQPRLF